MMDGQSLTPDKIKLQQLQELLPEAFSEGKIDWEKLKATLGEDITFSNERYVLNWAGKSEAFKVLQAPSTRTLIPAKEESINFNQTENIFIEGENLEVLKVLQKSYFGKVKMIYIDPPYNTGNDSFIYPDKFSETKDEYLKRVGDKDEEGYMTKDGMFHKNSKENGQYHSNWLNMMYPRMFLAKNLLRDDGVIFVSIDDNEVHNLRLLMNEVFGEENFVAQIVWQKKYGPANDAKYFSATHEYIIVYAKTLEIWSPILFERDETQLSAFKNPDNDPRGDWRASDLSARTASQSTYYPITLPSGKVVYPPASRSWIFNKFKFEELVKDNRIWFGVDGNGRPMQKKFITEVKEGITPQTWWNREFADDNKNARYEIKEIFPENVFETPKPTKLLKRIIEVATNFNNMEIILDFFAGSATIAHTIMDLNKEDGGNRKYICVQLPEICDEKSEAFKAGYKTIADIAKERIRRVTRIVKAEIKVDKEKKKGQLDFEPNKEETEIDLGFKVLKLSDSNFKQWQQIIGKDANALEEQMKLFVDPVSESATVENMVYELLLKSGKDLNSKIEHKPASSSDTLGYYCINNNELVFMLENATQ